MTRPPDWVLRSNYMGLWVEHEGRSPVRWTIRCRGFDLGIFDNEEEARAQARVLLRHDRWEVVSL